LGKIYKALEKSQQYATNKSFVSESNRLKTVKDVDSKVASKPFPMMLNPTKDFIDNKLVSFFKPESLESEQFRRLAANIFFHNPEKSSRCIMITSAAKGEGKSFVASNLAISMARSQEEPILLMDCDFRRPCLQKNFGIGDAPGLSDHLTKGKDISSLIKKTPIGKLSILPAGSKSFHSAELLSSRRISGLLKTLKAKNKNQFIIIDSPPQLSTAEPIAIAKSRNVDGIILVVKCESTPRKMVEDLINNFGKEKILGVVLNRFKKRFQAYNRYGIYQ